MSFSQLTVYYYSINLKNTYCRIIKARSSLKSVPLSSLHKVDGIIDLLQRHVVGYELIKFYFARHVVLNKSWNTVLALKT